MTVAVAWIRKVRDCEELVFVSDSRLAGDGLTFDGCPKIITMARNDCAISFAGYTGHAFPLMLQLALAIDSHSPSRRGSLDITELKSHALKVFNGMADLIQSSRLVSKEQDADPGAEFLFGGYSWIKKRFELWSIRFDTDRHQFIAKPAQWMSYVKYTGAVRMRGKANNPGTTAIGRIAYAGDQSGRAMELIRSKFAERAASGAVRPKRIDMEPFEVVRDMLRDQNHGETIGGAPQIVKVYQYMRTAPLAVYWPKKRRGTIHLQGRPCLGYERLDRWILDPDTLRSENPNYSRTVDDETTPRP